MAVITPWNWPLTLLVRSLVPALAAGNATVVKPASITPAITVEALALLAAQPGLPEGHSRASWARAPSSATRWSGTTVST